MNFLDIYKGVPIPKNLTQKKMAKFNNNIEYMNQLVDLINSSLNIFKWEGLPETCNERFLELSFLLRGCALMVKDENGNIMNLAAIPSSGYNIYGELTTAFGYGLNGFNKEYKLFIPGSDEAENLAKPAGGYVNNEEAMAVFGRDNAMTYPYINYLITAAKRISDIRRAQDVILQNLKTPVIITCDDAQLSTVKAILEDRENNQSAIVSNGKLPIQSFNIWDTHANPQTLTTVWEHYKNVKADICETIGIYSNPAPDKKERLIVDEVNANNDSTELSIDKRLHYRQKFAEECNEFLGTNISVYIDKDIINEDNSENIENKEDDENDKTIN